MKTTPSSEHPPDIDSTATAHGLLCQLLVERRLHHDDIITVALGLSAEASISEIAACLISHGIHLEESWVRRSHHRDVTSKRLQQLKESVNILRASTAKPARHGVLMVAVGRMDPIYEEALESWLRARGQL